MEVTFCPKARTEDLVVVDMPGETLVYDLVANEAHCLNKTASFVWTRCDGDRSIDEIAKAMEGEYRHAIDVDVVRLAVKQLDDNKLLKKSGFDSSMLPGRRSLIKKIGLASAVAIPIIASLAVPETARAQASCSCALVADCAPQPGCPTAACTNSACI